MFKIVSFLLFGVSFIRCDSDRADRIEIRIMYNETNKEPYCGTYSENYFKEDQHVCVIYETTTDELSGVTAERCYKQNNNTRTFATPIAKIYYFRGTKEEIVDVDMGTIWTCEFKDISQKSFFCHFPVYVRCDHKVDVSINEKTLAGIEPHYLVTEYDYESRYEYYDDELVYMTCESTSEINMKFEVKDFNNVSLTMPTDYIYGTKEIHLRAVLNKKHNLSYIDCIVQRTVHRDSIHRTFMVPKPNAPPSSELLVRVNGLILTPMSNKKTANYYYEEGELVNVTCKTFDTSLNQLELSFEDDVSREVIPIGPNAVSTYIKTSEIKENDEFAITCLTSSCKRKLSLIEAPKNDVIVQGLLQRNIIFSYINENSANIMVYEYRDNEVLNLTWMFGASRRSNGYQKFTAHVILIWKDELLANVKSTITPLSSNKITSKTINLSPQDHGSVIQIIIRYPRNRTHESWIVLRRDTGEGSITANSLVHSLGGILLIVSCVTCVVIILALLSIVFKYYRRYKRFPDETEECNEISNLSSTQFSERLGEYANTMTSNRQASTLNNSLLHIYTTPIPKKDQAVVRVNSLYEPLENDRHFESPNHETELYCEVPSRG